MDTAGVDDSESCEVTGGRGFTRGIFVELQDGDRVIDIAQEAFVLVSEFVGNGSPCVGEGTASLFCKELWEGARELRESAL